MSDFIKYSYSPESCNQHNCSRYIEGADSKQLFSKMQMYSTNLISHGKQSWSGGMEMKGIALLNDRRVVRLVAG